MSAVTKASAQKSDYIDPLIYPRIHKKPVNLDSIESITPETDVMVTGTFINIECPGTTAMICCKYYQGQQYFSQLMFDNETYTIPLSVARHINERCFSSPHGYLLNAKGEHVKCIKKVARYKFMIER